MTLGRQVVNPTIVVGLGARASELVARIETETGPSSLLRLLPISAPDDTTSVTLDAALGELSALEATTHARDLYGGVAPIDVFVVAWIGEDEVEAGALTALLSSLDSAVARLGRLMLLADGRPRLHVSPLLLLPPMPRLSTDPDAPIGTEQAEIIDLVRALDQRARTAQGPRARFGRIYLVENATRDFTLSDEQRFSMTASFLMLLLFGSLRTDERYRAIYQGSGDPFASFLLARIGLPLAGLRPWCRAKARLVALEAFATPREDELQAHKTAELDIDMGLAQVMERLNHGAAPRFDALAGQALASWGHGARPTPMGLFEGPRAFAVRAGEAWLAARLAAGEEAWALVRHDKSGQDDLVAAIDRDGAEWLKKARLQVDRHLAESCLGIDAPGNHRDALRIVKAARESVGARLDAAAKVAHASPESPRALSDLGDAHAALLAEARQKPEAAFLFGFGAALLAAITLVSSGPLGQLVGAHPLLVTGAIWILGALWLVTRLSRSTRNVNRLLAEEGRLGRALSGVSDEIRTHLRRRLEIALAHGEARLLTRHLAWLQREAAQLSLAEESLGRAIVEARDTLDHLRGTPGTPAPRIPDHPLETSLLSAERLGAWSESAIVRKLLGSDFASIVSRVKHLIDPYGDDRARAFERLDPLDQAVDRELASHTLARVLNDPDVGPEGTSRLLRAMRSVLALESIESGVGARLQLPLDLVAAPGESLDRRIVAPGEVLTYLQGKEVTPRDSELGRALGAAKTFHDPDRAYVLHVGWSVPANAIGWLRAETPSNVVELAARRSSEAGSS